LVRMVELNIENYRPYYLMNTFDFSVDPKKNFNVIIGGNGHGKTSIMDAISWCMYGIEQHKSGIHELDLVNDKIKNESEINDIITTSVEILFGENDRVEYRFLRSMDYRKTSDDTFAPVLGGSKFSVKVIDERDNVSDYPYPETAVNWIFPSKIKHLFKFDGEQLKNFFERDNSNKTKQAIKDITQINKLESVTSRINRVLKEYKPKKSSSKEIEDLDACDAGLKLKLAGFEENQRKLQEEYSAVETELNSVEGKLKALGDVNIDALTERQKTLDTTIKKFQAEITDTKKEKFSHILQSLPNIFCYQILDQANKKIEQKYESGELPSDIKEGFVKKLLEKHKCICHTELKEGSQSRKNVEEYLKLVPLSKYEDKIRHGQQNIGMRINSVNTFLEQRKLYETKLIDLEERLAEANEESKRVQSLFKNTNVENAKSLISQQTAYRNDLSRLTRDIGNIEGKIEATKNDITEVELDIKKLTRLQIKDEVSREKYEIGSQIADFITNLQETLLKELKNDIEHQTNSIFKQCLIEPRVDRVVITDDYECKVIDKKGNNLYSDLSEGQKESLAAAFIMALRKDSGFDSPIIFDFPFGRMDNNLRIETITSLNKVLSDVQVIFLLIEGTEFRELERKLMSDHLGSLYQLQKQTTEPRTEVIKLE